MSLVIAIAVLGAMGFAVGAALSFARFRSSAIGRRLVYGLVRTLESLRLAPAGSAHINRLLNVGARGFLTAGRLGIFTPMYFIHARKPTS